MRYLRAFICASLSSIALTICLAQAAAARYEYFKFDFPGASATEGRGINDLGQIVGWYSDSIGKHHAFILSNGHFQTITFSIPGTTIVQSEAHQINNCGSLVGQYTDSAGKQRGFVLEGWGATTIDPPGSTFSGAVGINDAGKIVGFFCTPCFVGIPQGYELAAGTFSILNFPGSAGPSGSATGINDHNQVVGLYENSSGIGTHGYRLSAGVYTSISVPGATSTAALGNNNAGQIVGTFDDSVPKAHGFLLEETTFTTLDVPGVTASGTNREAFWKINDRGVIVGAFTDPFGKRHGFVAVPSN